MSQVQVAAREFFRIKAVERKKLLICKLLKSPANRLWDLISGRLDLNQRPPAPKAEEYRAQLQRLVDSQEAMG